MGPTRRGRKRLLTTSPKKVSKRKENVVAVEVKEEVEDGGGGGPTCEFCGLGRSTMQEDLVRSGGFFRMGRRHFHYFCVLFSRKGDLEQLGGDNEGLFGFQLSDIKRELRLGQKDDCRFCAGPRATIRCAVCRSGFHFPCGAANGCAFVFAGRFDSFCRRHRPAQDKAVARQCSEDRTCIAGCMEDVSRAERWVTTRRKGELPPGAFPFIDSFVLVFAGLWSVPAASASATSPACRAWP